MRVASTIWAASTYSFTWWGMSRLPGPHVTIGMPSSIRRMVPSVDPGTPPQRGARPVACFTAFCMARTRGSDRSTRVASRNELTGSHSTLTPGWAASARRHTDAGRRPVDDRRRDRRRLEVAAPLAEPAQPAFERGRLAQHRAEAGDRIEPGLGHG